MALAVKSGTKNNKPLWKMIVNNVRPGDLKKTDKPGQTVFHHLATTGYLDPELFKQLCEVAGVDVLQMRTVRARSDHPKHTALMRRLL